MFKVMWMYLVHLNFATKYLYCIICYNIVGIQNESPQDVSLWYADDFELKATNTLWAQEKFLLLLNYLEKFK